MFSKFANKLTQITSVVDSLTPGKKISNFNTNPPNDNEINR